MKLQQKYSNRTNERYLTRLNSLEMKLYSEFQSKVIIPSKFYQVNLSEPEMRMYAEFQKEFGFFNNLFNRTAKDIKILGKSSAKASVNSAGARQIDVAQRQVAAQEKQAVREASRQARIQQMTPEQLAKRDALMNSPEAIAKRQARADAKNSGGIDWIQHNAENAGQYKSKQTLTDMSYAHDSQIKNKFVEKNSRPNTSNQGNPSSTPNTSNQGNSTDASSSENKPGFFKRHWKGMAAGTAGLGAGYLMFGGKDDD